MSQKRARNQVAARVKTADDRLLRAAALRLGLQFAAVILASLFALPFLRSGVTLVP